jgi:hypothetical protein
MLANEKVAKAEYHKILLPIPNVGSHYLWVQEALSLPFQKITLTFSSVPLYIKDERYFIF